MSARSNTFRWALISLLLVITCSRAFAGKTLYVDDDGPADFNNIQAAIDDSNNGDTILVADGTYTGEGNRDIDFRGKAITLKSENGPDTCIIDCQGNIDDLHRGFYFHSKEDANSILQGFTVTNGYIREDGGAIYCNMSSPSIIDCIITNNKALRSRAKGGGIALVESEAHIISCVVRNNIAQQGDGGGISISNNGGQNPRITRCIISGNTAIAHPRFGGEGGGVALFGNGYLLNCVVTGNIAGYWGGGISCRMPHHQGFLSNSIVWANICPRKSNASQLTMPTCNYDGVFSLTIVNSIIADSNGNDGIYIMAYKYNCLTGAWLTINPLFLQPGYWDISSTPDFLFGPGDDIWIDGDYHLKSQAGRWDPNSQRWVQDDVTSPCIDAGDMSSPIGFEPFPNGGIINMGAYGGTAEASKSYFGEPVCETIIAGDINGDCKVDYADLVLMAAHWLECTTPECDLDHQPPPGGGPSMPNPAAVYCHALGYEYKIVTDDEGNQYGICIFPDGSECGSWDFYRGKCGQEWSYCKLHGYDLKELGRYEGWFKGAICIDKTTKEEIGTVFDLFMGEFLSWSLPYPVGDLNQDCRVNLLDFAIMALHWLEER